MIAGAALRVGRTAPAPREGNTVSVAVPTQRRELKTVLCDHCQSECPSEFLTVKVEKSVNRRYASEVTATEKKEFCQPECMAAWTKVWAKKTV